MDISILKNALPKLQEQLAKIEQDLSELERNAFEGHHEHADDGPAYDDTDVITRRMAFRLESLYRQACMILEAAGLAATRAQVVEALARFSKRLDVITRINDLDVLDSEPLAWMRVLLEGLIAISGQGPSAEEVATVKQLESILRSLPHLVAKRNKKIEREEDIQAVMDDYLSAVFSGDSEASPHNEGRRASADWLV